MQQLNHIPEHIAIIMDGNGRWAKAKGLPRTAGHVEGVTTVKRITEEAARMGVKYLTLYTFSTENWNRPQTEVEALMDLVITGLEEELFTKNNIRLRVIGEWERLPENVRRSLGDCMEHTAGNTRMTLTIALSYSSRWELTRAVQDIVKEGLRPEEITEETLSRHLTTSFMPDPDLLIRTGGELRISNYLLWQCAYTEFYFTDEYWPDFTADSLHRAVEEYQKRQRRYGKTGDQITNEQ
ncbi:MAG: isoprenyl transferase [Bacteroidaceae bacterium]|nr:isoprenyl transferase [Bacteroidaceae bacterium]MBR7051517.1 isoprenyl transferase [Bacteroidaceae bacterium]